MSAPPPQYDPNAAPAYVPPQYQPMPVEGTTQQPPVAQPQYYAVAPQAQPQAVYSPTGQPMYTQAAPGSPQPMYQPQQGVMMAQPVYAQPGVIQGQPVYQQGQSVMYAQAPGQQTIIVQNSGAVVLNRQPVNHACHCILFLCLGPIWLIFWVMACLGLGCERPCGC